MCVFFYYLIGLAWCDVFKVIFKGYLINWLNHQTIKCRDRRFSKIHKINKNEKIQKI